MGDDWFNELQEMSRPKVSRKPWMDSKKMELVTSLEMLDRIVDECIAAKLFAWDLETTGLDTRVFFNDDGTHYMNEQIVGHCLSPDGISGYYVPVRHRTPKGESHSANLPISGVLSRIKRLASSEAVAIFHNSKFDCEFLQFSEAEAVGEWDKHKSFEDTLVLAYLRNTRQRKTGLKAQALEVLGFEMIELDELFSEEEKKQSGKNFAVLDPTWGPALWYACSDAICTRLLFDPFIKEINDPEPHGKSQKDVYIIEKRCLPSTRWMERCRIFIDRDKVVELIGLGQVEWFASLEEVYAEAGKMLGRNIRPGWYRVMRGEVPNVPSDSIFKPEQVSPDHMQVREEAMKVADRMDLDPLEISDGKRRIRTIKKEVASLQDPKKKESVAFAEVYDVTIPTELGLLLRELGVPGLRLTDKSGQIKTSKDEIERVLEEAGDQFPFMAKVRRFREVAKALGSNLFPIYEDTVPKRSPDGTVKVGFAGHKVDTGRFATPQPKENEFHGQVRWNLHSIPATYDTKKPACMLRIRECVAARPGRIMFAVDFAGVELRIGANYSREPKWVDEFFRCSGCGHKFNRGDGKTTPEAPPPFCPECGSDKIGDLHTLTAIGVYGEKVTEEKDFKKKRQGAKALNFAMMYGGGGSAAQRAVGVDKDEGWRIKRQFDATYPTLRDWWSRQHRFARKYKYVVTAFGRRYPLPDIDHEFKSFQAKAERNAVNGPVQGFSADMTKLAMALIYEICKERGWLRRVYMTITIHDELVFEIEEAIAEEAVELFVQAMTRNKYILSLNQPVPYRCDIEFGANWTAKNNLTQMAYNKVDPKDIAKGHGKWDERLVRIFPKAYASYLAHGGVPVDGVVGGGETPPGSNQAPEGSAITTATPLPSAAGPTFEAPKTGKGEVYKHVIPEARLTYATMVQLAQLIRKVDLTGVEHLRVETDTGFVLYDDDVPMSAVKFKILAEAAGI